MSLKRVDILQSLFEVSFMFKTVMMVGRVMIFSEAMSHNLRVCRLNL